MASKMAPDLLQQISNEFRGETIDRMASAIGEAPAKTQTALSSVIPALLSGLAGKASTTEGANDVLDAIRGNNLTSVNLADVTRPDGITKLTDSGRSLMGLALGGRASSVIDWIATHAGISRSSVSSLASICTPLVLGLIGRRLTSTGLNASSLSGLLGGPGKFLQNAPAGLSSALGMTGAAAAARHFADETEPRVPTAPTYAAPRTSSAWKWILPLLLGLGALGLFAYLLSQRQDRGPTVTTQPTGQTEVAPPPVAPAPAAPIAPTSTSVDLGAFIDTKLPNGITLHIPSKGVENTLLAFIGDPSKAVDKDTWFSFDRLEFETDSAQLKPSSREQLSNVAAILKAYPQVALKIGGYTDNTGDAAHNLKLSQDRATSTLNELVTLGIAKSRLSAEGYGQQFPVADNGTPEGRQRNRRIDIRVTRK